MIIYIAALRATNVTHLPGPVCMVPRLCLGLVKCPLSRLLKLPFILLSTIVNANQAVPVAIRSVVHLKMYVVFSLLHSLIILCLVKY